IPPAIAGPGPIIDAPRARTPFTVENSRFESNSHSTEPSFVANARRAPSFDPEKMTPGMTVSAADCAALQPRPLPHFAATGAAIHTRSPDVRATACRPPGFGRVMSDTAKYACVPSTADPHSIPPSTPPSPARYCQTTSPCLSGSNAQPTPDFCPITIRSRPSARVARIGALPKSTSGPFVSGQFGLALRPQPET